MTWGDKFTQKEVNEAMDACEVDDNGKPQFSFTETEQRDHSQLRP